MSRKLLLQEDDYAPDAYTHFTTEFKKRFGCTFEEFKNKAEQHSEEDYFHITYKSLELNILVEMHEETPCWAVYELQ